MCSIDGYVRVVFLVEDTEGDAERDGVRGGVPLLQGGAVIDPFSRRERCKVPPMLRGGMEKPTRRRRGRGRKVFFLGWAAFWWCVLWAVGMHGVLWWIAK